MLSLNDKSFFRIGEVAELVSVPPHVIRYWEKMFPELKPMKTRGAHRVFTRNDLELMLRIRELIDAGYTVSGARAALFNKGSKSPDAATESPRADARWVVSLKLALDELAALKQRLGHMLESLSGKDHNASELKTRRQSDVAPKRTDRQVGLFDRV